MLTKDLERLWNAMRIAEGLLSSGEKVKIFFTGEGVEALELETTQFNLKELFYKILQNGGEFFS
nr:DsrE family protein [Caldimicrobium thiodismutans]